MGAALGLDKIGNLIHSSGLITLSVPPWSLFNVVTIGGQQYRTGSLNRTISLDVPILSSITRYQVFLVVVGGQPALRISTNENSVGPVGFGSWNLVGSFYTNNLSPVTLGAFINVDGIPESDWMPMNTTIGASTFLHALTSDPSYGTVIFNNYRVRRRADEVLGEWNFKQGSAGGPGNGHYLIKLAFAPDLQRYKNAASEGGLGTIGMMRFQEGSLGTFNGNSVLYLYAPFADIIGAQVLGTNSAGNSLGGNWAHDKNHLGVSNLVWGMDYHYIVSGWTKTPIRNL